ncbi:MAG: esterase/lipase family protein [Hominimerdicola sp.]
MAKCSTKYPIFLVHGLGFRDRKHFNYWGRIPKQLEKNGAKIYYGNQDANATIETNALILRKSLKKVLAESGKSKVNIIAHSKGGLEARYLISSLGMGKYVASLSTINSPHNGSKVVDILLKAPDSLVRMVGGCTDLFMKIGGDKKPETYRVFHQFTTDFAQNFNFKNPDCDDVFYQSFGFKMKSCFDDITMTIPYLIVKKIDDENDGVLSEKSVRWTNFHGMYVSSGKTGISHTNQVDLRRRKFSSKKPKSDLEIADITDFYIDLVSKLKDEGY